MITNSFLKIHRRQIFSILILGMIISLTSLPVQALGDKYAGEFLKIGVGVREMSLGGASLAAPLSTAAVYWNPASLADARSMTGEFMHTEEFAGVLNLDYIAIALPGSADWNYGMAFFRSGVDGIPDTRSALIDENDNGELDAGERLDFGKIGTFGASENALFFAMARRMNPKLNIGGSVKTLYKNLGTADGFGIGFDMALQYRVMENLYLGVILRDATTTFLYYPDGDNEFIAPSIQLGAATTYAPSFLPLVLRLSLAIDVETEGETHQSLLNLGFISSALRAGLEMQIKEHILLRIGRDDLGNTQIGLGLQTLLGRLDYGLAMGGSYAELGSSHRIGLTLHFAELGRFVREYL